MSSPHSCRQPVVEHREAVVVANHEHDRAAFLDTFYYTLLPGCRLAARPFGLDRKSVTINKSEVVKTRLAVAAGHRHVDINPVIPVPVKHRTNFALD